MLCICTTNLVCSCSRPLAFSATRLLQPLSIVQYAGGGLGSKSSCQGDQQTLAASICCARVTTSRAASEAVGASLLTLSGTAPLWQRWRCRILAEGSVRHLQYFYACRCKCHGLGRLQHWQDGSSGQVPGKGMVVGWWFRANAFGSEREDRHELHRIQPGSGCIEGRAGSTSALVVWAGCRCAVLVAQGPWSEALGGRSWQRLAPLRRFVDQQHRLEYDACVCCH
jgi:hypothetical protein